MPSASPARTARLTPCTARTIRPRRRKVLASAVALDHRDVASAHRTHVCGCAASARSSAAASLAPAGGEMVRRDCDQRRRDRPAAGLGERAARSAKRQPGGGSSSDGGAPSIGTSVDLVAAHVGKGVRQAHRVGMERRLQHRARPAPIPPPCRHTSPPPGRRHRRPPPCRASPGSSPDRAGSAARAARRAPAAARSRPARSPARPRSPAPAPAPAPARSRRAGACRR